MADLNGAGSATVGGWSATGAGRTERWLITLVWPGQALVQPLTAPTLSLLVDAWDDAPVQVQVQVATTSGFTTIVGDQTFAAPGDNATEGETLVTGLTDGATYYWRARWVDSGQVGPWTTAQWFRVVVDTGDAAEQVFANVGFEPKPSEPDATSVEPVMINVGFLLVSEPDATSVEPVMVNVGFLLASNPDAVDSAMLNVTSDPPMPRIWFLRPPSGREGDGVEVVGWGFGVLPEDYDAVVEIELEPGVWTTMPIVTFQTFPPTPDAYTENRVLSSATGEVDWQHTRIAVVVPPGAEPPGYPVRVRTVTP